MPERNSPPQFDPTGVTFPSDRITFGHMRRREPGLFTREAIDAEACSGCDAFSLFHWELVLAEKSFAAALGFPDPNPKENREFIIRELLDDAYRTYGLSTGIHETRQLARAVEDEAVRQARRLQGPSRY